MINKTSLFGQIPPESQAILNSFDLLLQNIKSLNSRQLQQLPTAIRELSHNLTDERSSRRIGYMNETITLTAYTRYFMWWNLIRIVPLFSGFLSNPQTSVAFNSLTDGSILIDVGSGPLTLPIAFWLACPELRKKKLVWYCLDCSPNALAQGEEIYLSVASRTSQTTPDQQLWQIIRVKGVLGTDIRKKAAFLSCANMFNELYWNSSRPLEETSKKYSTILASYMEKNSSLLIIEPGIPRASRFITLLRNSFIRKGWNILSPCPHETNCPMDGRKGGKWCHFTLLTDNAPDRLMNLSRLAGIPKDRASFSFVFVNRNDNKNEEIPNTTGIRVISDPIYLLNKTIGRYACSNLGLTLAMAPENSLSSGDICNIELSPNQISKLSIDQKSGAKKIPIV